MLSQHFPPPIYLCAGYRGGRERARVVELQRLHPLLHAPRLRGLEDRGRLPFGPAEDRGRSGSLDVAQRRRQVQDHVDA